MIFNSIINIAKTKRMEIVKNNKINKLEKLLERLDVDISLAEDEERETKYKQEVNAIIDSIKPKYLYKFKSCSKHAFDNLVNDELYLNIVSQFNDPTESMAYVDPELLLNLAAEINILDQSVNEDNNFDKYHMLQKLDLMNDALEYICYLRDRLKIACLSEVFDSTLMWSHYADCHKGFAIRYRIDDFKIIECSKCTKREICWRPDNMLYPVIYKNKRFNATLIALSKAIILRDGMLKEIGWTEEELPIPILSVLQKEIAWKYEKEWRIICKNFNNETIKIKPDALYLGEDISCENAIKLSRIAKKKGIPLYKMSIDYYSPEFNLDYEDWSDYTVKEIKDLYSGE